ncbi:MAG: UDP-N-acetylglucosamine 1-carboxyvinyltransferase [Anaerolineae bacterium]|nr:UDP-N-acetylglucosamine 1-carboxyvinyltransferase [Anaerolineae bacterium]
MRIRVTGQQPLNGTYQPSGNPNAAIALIAASLLTDQPVTLKNVPLTASTEAMLKLAEWTGAQISYDQDCCTTSIHAVQLTQRVLAESETALTTGALLLLAPILVRRQHVRLEFDFPLNRIRAHIEALRDLGIGISTTNGAVECNRVNWDYRDIILAQASVTATALVMMLAATLGKETIIHNAACEPHIRELAYLLEEMGVHIEGIGSNLLRIISPPELQGANITIGPNHIETASIAAIGALTGGRIQIEGTRREDLRMITTVYERLGIRLDVDESEVFVPRHQQLTVSEREEDVDASIETSIWPGFPSDLVAIATVVATQARGTSLIHEKLFNNRLLFVDRLKAMGAQIVLCDPHRAIVIGPSPLYGVYLDSPDVRAGLGMLAAALVAKDVTTIDNAQAIEQNFAGVFAKLKNLGAQIEIE